MPDDHVDWIAHYKAVKARLRGETQPARVNRGPIKGRRVYAEPIGPVIHRDIWQLGSTPTWRHILAEVCTAFGCDEAQLRGRGRAYADARQELVYRLRAEAGLSTPHIGRILERDHSTIIYAYYRHLELNPSLILPADRERMTAALAKHRRNRERSKENWRKDAARLNAERRAARRRGAAA